MGGLRWCVPHPVFYSQIIITVTVSILFGLYNSFGIFLNNSYVCLFSALNSSVSWIPPKMKDEGKLRLYRLRLW